MAPPFLRGSDMSVKRLQRLEILLAGLVTVAIFAGAVSTWWLWDVSRRVPYGVWVAASLMISLMVTSAGLVVLSRVLGQLRRLESAIRQMHATNRLLTIPDANYPNVKDVVLALNDLVAAIESRQQRQHERLVELEQAKAVFDQLQEYQEGFLETINHQVRTPLTSITEGIELLRDGAVGTISHEQGDIIHMLDQNAQRLEQLVEEALDLSLMTSGRRPLYRKPDNVQELLRQVVAAWATTSQQRIVTEFSAELPLVYMDSSAIRDVMDHVMRNALRHAPERSQITVGARGSNETAIEIWVQDQGPGMSSEQLAKLFLPFVHVHTPYAPGSQGSGLGLALCRQIIERHHGTIHATSQPGHGMVVAFTLPLASPAFLFAEACRDAREDAEYGRGRYGVVLATGADDPGSLAEAERALREHTHEGDRFVWLSPDLLAIVAVTDRLGLEAMTRRLRDVLGQAHLNVRLASAIFPEDGESPARLLEIARSRFHENGQGARNE